MHNKPLLSMFNVEPRLGVQVNLLSKAIDKFGDTKTFFSKYRNPIGIELEIENVSAAFRERVHYESMYWKYHEEGSLKDNGAEFVSHPVSGQNIDYAILEFARMSAARGHKYGIRTSTHIHVNVSFMNFEEFASLILCSAYFEPLLFTLCSPERKHNPYCYSIALLTPEEVFSYNPELKYCGINTAPVQTQLSLEYRQLHGTDDWKLIRRWIQVLCKLYFFAKSTPYKEVSSMLREGMRTRNHDTLAKKIFGASLVLFPELSVCNENLLWTLVATDYLEGL